MIKIRQKTKKMSKKKLAIISVFFILLVAILSGGLYVSSLLSKINKVDIKEENLGMTDVSAMGDVSKIQNIALFGVDSKTDKGRSDSIMILTLDQLNKKMKITSIMRDSYVNIPGKGMDKINHAYAFGGPELAIKTINENFGLNINKFITVNFESLGAIIDSLGGVQLKITEEEVSKIPGINSNGVHTLTGDQALAYARIRYAKGGDYQRTQRQRNIIQSIYESFRYTELSDYPKLISSFLPHVTSNMGSSELLSVGTDFYKTISSGLEQERFPRDGEGKGTTINGIYYLQYDLNKAKEDMQKYIFKNEKVAYK
ncbi:LCP family protein [Clostridium mediterraneense]|uniref:LCP family protein n=1 Tax=Clostridium mediterraneense TaxID=1805472 RepID=UPI000830065A|nr:LCP family protein [Clostridium mediterraneense]